MSLRCSSRPKALSKSDSLKLPNSTCWSLLLPKSRRRAFSLPAPKTGLVPHIQLDMSSKGAVNTHPSSMPLIWFSSQVMNIRRPHGGILPCCFAIFLMSACRMAKRTCSALKHVFLFVMYRCPTKWTCTIHCQLNEGHDLQAHSSLTQTGSVGFNSADSIYFESLVAAAHHCGPGQCLALSHRRSPD